MNPIAQYKASKEPPRFSYPSVEAGGYHEGMVWYAGRPMTPEDEVWLRSQPGFGEETLIDQNSVCGRWDKDWNTANAISRGEQASEGGEGSRMYMEQNLLDGVDMKHEEIYHYMEDTGDPGTYTRDIPRSRYGDGCTWTRNTAWGPETVAGVEPGSPMEKFLDAVGGTVVWDDGNQFWEVMVNGKTYEGDQEIEESYSFCPHCGEAL